MPVDSSEVVIGGNGHVYVAPEGTAVPTDPGASIGSPYVDLGYISEDGVSFTGGTTVEDIAAWQSFYPIRKLITAKEATVEFVMRQWNGENLKLAFGGGEINNNAGITTYTPPTPSEFDTRVMVVQWEDGDNNFVLCVPKGLVSGDTTTVISRTAAADLAISFAITPTGDADNPSNPPTADELGTQPWYILSDADSFVT